MYANVGRVSDISLNAVMIFVCWIFRPTVQSSATGENEHHTLWHLPTSAWINKYISKRHHSHLSWFASVAGYRHVQGCFIL